MEENNNNLGKAIPFIVYEKNKGFKLTDESIQFLENIEENFGVISIVGKYRTGKSYFINKILLNEKEGGFQVGSTVNACTKGLWIYNKLIYNETNKRNYLIIDTEGFGGINEGKNHDTRIFLFSMLLSSYFIYNSVGAINEIALQNLSLIINLAKEVKLNEDDENENEEELVNQFPYFMWIVRDFSLKLIDENNKEITSKEYLENVLNMLKGISDEVESKNQIRRLLKFFFKNRDCFTMVRPVESEKNLQKLNEISDEFLRKEFLNQIEILREKIFRKCKLKKLKGKLINGKSFLEIAKSYRDSINKGNIVKIENAWVYVCRNESENLISSLINDLKSNLLNNTDFTETKLIEIKEQNRKLFENKIISNNNIEIEEFKLQLNNKIEEAFTEKKKKFQVNVNKKINEYLENKFLDLKYNIINEKKSISIIKKEFNDIYEKCLEDFDINKNVFDEITEKKRLEKLNYFLSLYYEESERQTKYENENNKNKINELEKEIEINNVKNKELIKNTLDKNTKLEEELLNYKSKIEIVNTDFNKLKNKYLYKKQIQKKVDNDNKEKENKIKLENEQYVINLQNEYEIKINKLLQEKINLEKELSLKNQEINFLNKDKEKIQKNLENYNNDSLLNKKIINELNYQIDNLKNELNNKINLQKEMSENKNISVDDWKYELKKVFDSNLENEKKIKKYEFILNNSLYIICSCCKEKFSNGIFFEHLNKCINDYDNLFYNNKNPITLDTKFIITINNQYDLNDFSKSLLIELKSIKNHSFIKKNFDDFFELIFEIENEFPNYFFSKSLNNLLKLHNNLDDILECDDINYENYIKNFEKLLEELNKNNILRESDCFKKFLKIN